MKYTEEHMWPLTGGTTCYTGIRDRKGATEWHTLQLTSDCALSSQQITPRDNALVCVGYSATASHECLVFLDLSCFDSPETPFDTQQQPPHSTSNNDRTNDLDDQSVSNATINTTTTSTTRANSPENNAPQLMTLSFDSLPPSIEPQSTQAAALLMIRSLEDRQTVEFTKTLNYRPLSPLLCHFSDHCMGVWVGSSDHSELHLYVCQGSVWQSHHVHKIPAFQLTSPVMSLDYSPPNCLVVACQDGTIRVILFQFDGCVFSNVSQQQVMVDGPIVCLSVRSLESSSKWLITAGSLCGYAMEWFVDAEHTIYNPSMIAKGFWNGAIAAEDSVLAVRSTDNRVLMGTQSGKVLLYGVIDNQEEKKMVKRSFRLLWQCQLPYSVHEVEFLHDERLLVTTRKSIHIFQKGSFGCVEQAASIRSRLMTRMQREDTCTDADEILVVDPVSNEDMDAMASAQETAVSEASMTSTNELEDTANDSETQLPLEQGNAL